MFRPNNHKNNNSDKLQRVVLHPSFLNELGKTVVLILSLPVAVYWSQIYKWSVQYIPLFHVAGFLIELPIPLFGIFPLVLACAILHRTYNFRYVLGEEDILEESGILGFCLKQQRIPYIHIRSVTVEQSIPQRVLRIGLIRLSTSIHSLDSDITLDGIAKPEHYRELINSRIMQAIEKT